MTVTMDGVRRAMIAVYVQEEWNKRGQEILMGCENEWEVREVFLRVVCRKMDEVFGE